MKENYKIYEKQETNHWAKAIICMGVSVLGFCCTVGESYKCGHWAKCKILVERGHSPVEIFSDQNKETSKYGTIGC